MHKIASFKVGDTTTRNNSISDELVRRFAEISGDVNPVHLDEEYASTTIFKKRIAHGMLLSSFISATLANQMPGEGTIYLKQGLSFKKPAYIGDTITTELEIISIDTERNSMTISTICRNQNGEVLISGEAVVMVSALDD
jgi:3-hydroxybutyryl-CoA dehydratase